jgi:hypothetical protein
MTVGGMTKEEFKRTDELKYEDEMKYFRNRWPKHHAIFLNYLRRKKMSQSCFQ